MKKITVTYSDGTTETAKVMTPDQVRFDMHRARMGWPSFQDAPFLGMSYWTWAALNRTHATTLDFDTWIETVADLVADDAPEVMPDPTTGAPPSGN
ncbi:hypothetical protein [Corynebacterium freiburgense]|uniref:hypothetical protein n=1 Tax=Corynebacterium freiburgense TaxID=556548 RepID=UPI0004091C0A|nr:hypothetical protein [Corynebacterium freiburgense]WJZ03476.1 hypothetical protein CFREI_11035 [Corynebacterium freiburgense]WJZ03572.1 hypothetical protein CFREI_11565 [Corynebacterium freiburgense]WJZ03989.1 hypothetical protein CFREI_13715 [Corynebacterium freiburgense]